MINTLSDKNRIVARNLGHALARGVPKVQALLWISLDRSMTQVDFEPFPANPQLIQVRVNGLDTILPMRYEDQSMLMLLDSFPHFRGELDLLCQFISLVIRTALEVKEPAAG